MDFSLSEEQKGVQTLAKRIFRETATEEVLRNVEADGSGFAPAVWHTLATSGLLGVGADGLGLFELCLVIEQQGASAAPVPLWSALAVGGLAVERFGSAAQRESLLAPLARGELVLTAALLRDGASAVAADGDRLSGVADCVPALPVAGRVLVPAGDAVYVVDTAAEGVGVERQTPTDHESMGRLRLDGARGERLGDAGQRDEIVRFMTARGRLALCALSLGAAGRALRLTAKYVAERKQFGRAIGSFQAVGQRAADAYVDVEVMRLSLWRAVWLVAEGRDAEREIAVAKYFAAEAGHRVVCAAQHLHGGMGFDRDYPLYRLFLIDKQSELTLGSASAELGRLGALVAAE